LQAKSLEHRLKIAIEEQCAKEAKAASLEGVIAAKDAELLAALNSASDKENLRRDNHERTIESLKDSLRSTEELFLSTSKQLEMLQIEFNQSNRDHGDEVDRFKRQLEYTKQEAASSDFKAKSVESELDNLKNMLREKEYSTLMIEESSKMTESEFKAREEEIRRKLEKADMEKREMMSRTQVLEMKIQSLEEKISNCHEQIAEKDSVTISLQNKLADAELETTRAIRQTQTLSSEVQSFARDREQYEHQVW